MSSNCNLENLFTDLLLAALICIATEITARASLYQSKQALAVDCGNQDDTSQNFNVFCSLTNIYETRIANSITGKLTERYNY